MEEVTNNILVTHPLSEETSQEVRRLVLLPLEEPVSSEEEERSSKRKSDPCDCYPTDLGNGKACYAPYICSSRVPETNIKTFLLEQTIIRNFLHSEK